MEKPSSKQVKPRVIIVALPLQGHINPTIQLAIKLASNDFTVTFINAEHIHYKITQSNNNDSNNIIFHDTNLDIEYLTVSDGLPLDYDRSSNHENWAAALFHCYPAHVEVVVAKIVRDRGSSNVGCLIADGYSNWASNMAKKYGMLHVCFWTEAALVLNVYFHVNLLMENGHLGPGARNDEINYIPGVDSIKPSDLTSHLQENSLTTTTHQRLFSCMDDIKRADFILCNTVQELEIGPISAIQAQIPLYAIGPLNNQSPISTSLWAEFDCTQWLNAKSPQSVLYVSFGSYVHLAKKDVAEIAHGINLSGFDFLWALRPGTVRSDDSDPLPIGFSDEVLGRGMVVSWTNQKDVLSHAAIGAFLTHCGWNSILENMCCGVPLLCFPLLGDQFGGRKLVVNDWKIGYNLCDETTVTRDEVS